MRTPLSISISTRKMFFAAAAAALAACAGAAPPEKEDTDVADDVEDALAALPDAEVLHRTFDGLPTYIVGELGKAGAMQMDDGIAADQAMRPSLAPILAAFRMTTADIQLRHMNVDENGNRYFRYQQVFDGVPVIGGDLVVSVDVKGAIFGANGSARGDISGALGQNPVSQATAHSQIFKDNRFGGLAVESTRPVYVVVEEGRTYKAYETIVSGTRNGDPARDKVYVDMDSGEIVAVYPTIHFAQNRKVYSANNGTSLPGTIKRTEGAAATTDTDVNAAYDNTGSSYQAYNIFWGRDSYDNAGATLTSTVHYSNNYCNAFWNGTQMVYGDGNSSQNCFPLARSLDVTAHELTHAVTEYESGLVYQGESGGFNEALSDIFGAFVEAWVDGGKNGTNLTVSNDTWLVGEDILPPALRYMCDPAADGASHDFWSSSTNSVDVHYSSGVGNLAFCLMSKGGTHPRGKSNINVPSIGMEKAIRVFYKAQVDLLTSTSKYAQVRSATEQAATALGYDQATKDAISCAWAAVNVGTAPAACGGTTPPPPPSDGVLANGTPISNISGAKDSQAFWRIDVPTGQTSLTITITGGTGDADLYVSSGTKPTLTSYQCRPYKSGNVETCTFSPPTAGAYYVMLHAYSAYSGVTLTGKYEASSTSGDPLLTNGVAVTNISGAASSAKYWRVTTPAGKALSIKISGGTGDADLYTRFGSRPTTSTYACRPYLSGNTETCNTASTSAGDYYVMVRGYTAYSGLQLIASY